LATVLGALMLVCCSHTGAVEWEFVTQRTLLPVRVGSAWGYVDRQGVVRIKPQFKEASEFCNGYAVVKTGEKDAEKYGLIVPSGQFTIQPTFDRMYEANSENLIAVCMGHCAWDSNDARWGFADVRTGALKIRPQYTKALPFSEHLAAVCTGACNDTYDKTFTKTEASGKWGFIDASAPFVISPQFDNAEWFHKGVAKVTLGSGDNARSGYIDQHGAFVAGPS
jgi:hypothetical protein